MHWIQTYTGRVFYPRSPHPKDIHIRDIAHHLSMLCRFTGAVSHFYSVAQHSVLVASVVPPEDRLWALLHDAAEAYVNDLNRPTKHGPGLEAYRHIIQAIEVAVCERFRLPTEMPASVHEADERMLWTEKRDLLVPLREPQPGPWSTRGTGQPYGFTIEPWSPSFAEFKFLEAYLQYRRPTDPRVDA